MQLHDHEVRPKGFGWPYAPVLLTVQHIRIVWGVVATPFVMCQHIAANAQQVTLIHISDSYVTQSARGSKACPKTGCATWCAEGGEPGSRGHDGVRPGDGFGS